MAQRKRETERAKEIKKEREREGRKNGNMRVVYLAEPVNDMKGWLLSVIIRDNSLFVLASMRSEWKGNACAYYTILDADEMK